MFSDKSKYPVVLSDVQSAHERIAAFVHETPVRTSKALDQIASARAGRDVSLFFKCENFQKTGSFKIRGATNAVFSLKDEEASNGVCTH